MEVVRGDITRERTDAIVNAANEHLVRGGGVCGAIFAAAGPGLAEACAALGGCRPGDACATPGFALPARWIIHAVGPRWAGGERGEAAVLASCYRRVLEVCDELGARSVAVPAISTGIFGYPLEPATRIAVSTVASTPSTLEVVRFVCFDDSTYAAYTTILGSAP